MTDYPIGRNDAIPSLVPNVPREARCTCAHALRHHRLSNEIVNRVSIRGDKYREVVWDRLECSDCDCQHYHHKEFVTV